MRSLRLDAVEPLAIGERGLRWLPLRHLLGVEAFGINAYTASNEGDEVVEEHDETGENAGKHQEVYVVVAGHATFRAGDKQLDAPVGTVVFFEDSSERRGAVARQAGTTVLAIGATRGTAFEISPWEFSFRAFDRQRAGDAGAARSIVADGLAHHPDHPTLLYNLACYESLTGRRDKAIAYLTRACQLDPELVAVAQDDDDLVEVRDDPRFPR